MASSSETTLIVWSAPTTAHLILPSTSAFCQIFTAIGLTITPLLAKLGHIIARNIDMGSGEEPSITFGEGVRPAAVIIGFGRVGRLVADMLRVHNQPFVAVESDIDTVAQARSDGYPIIFVDVSNTALITNLHLVHSPSSI